MVAVSAILNFSRFLNANHLKASRIIFVMENRFQILYLNWLERNTFSPDACQYSFWLVGVFTIDMAMFFFWWRDLKRHCLHQPTTEPLPKSNRLDCHTTEIAWILKFASQKTSWPHWCGFRTQKFYIKQSQNTQHHFLFAKDKSDTHRRMCLCI